MNSIVNKRCLLFLLLVVNLTVIIAVVWHYRQRPPSVTSDLSENSIRTALAILQRERKMWGHFTNMSGHITVEVKTSDETYNKNHPSFQCDVSVRQIDSDPDRQIGLIWRFEMTISNKQDGWRVITDGTKENTKLDCQDKQKVPRMNPATILTLLCLPKNILVPLDNDALFPKGKQRLIDILGPWNPWLNQHAKDIPYSYVFKDKEGRTPEIYFTQGHLSGLRKARSQEAEEEIYSFEAPAESNGFWYPTHIEAKTKNQTYTITLSSVVIGIK